jgi:hypothetical protein
MEPDQSSEYLDKLDRIEFELTEQDTLIQEQMKRSPNTAVHQSQRDLLQGLFREVQDLKLAYSLPSVDSDDPDSLRPEIRSARAKVVWKKKRIQQRLGLIDAPSKGIVWKFEGDLVSTQAIIFIGHGRAKDWLELKVFEGTPECCVRIQQRVGGWIAKPTALRRHAQACHLRILGAEDQHADGRPHARENVIHEAGLFQGKLGFRKAILLVEDECERPSNVHGLTYIGFPKHRISAAFEEIRRVLEREHII